MYALIFNRPLWMRQESEETPFINVFGACISPEDIKSVKYPQNSLDRYVAYLAGSCEWMMREEHEVSDEDILFLYKENNKIEAFDFPTTFCYCLRCVENLSLDYEIYDISGHLFDYDFDDGFIVNDIDYFAIKRLCPKVDVQTIKKEKPE
mgnify:CR=1 FL=1